jgi:hypothetical protein
LVKGTTTYKIIVPQKVEEKIRYLCRKFPTLEWSGILFTSYEGNFEDGSLVITCQDLYPMDLGTSTYTDFKMDETVAGYIAENIDLFGCDMNLIHSHNQMSCFFSGTDTSTLRSEGNDQNCFVSLIVNNAGTYCAAITRKVQEKKTIVTKNYSSTYEFFGEGEKTANVLAGTTENIEVENTYIEYFMLDVEIEHEDNPLAYLDIRFDEIQEAKKKRVPVTSTTINPPVIKASEDGNHSPWIPNKSTPVVNSASRAFGNDFDEDYSFREWQNRQNKAKEPTLFSDDEMAEMVDTSGWKPDPTIIHRLVCQMVTCSLIVSDKVDLKQWITKWMDKKYEELFSLNPSQFDEWREFIVEFQINQYIDSETPDEVLKDMDLYYSKIASAMHNELYPYSNNEYITSYMEVLTRYIYE